MGKQRPCRLRFFQRSQRKRSRDPLAAGDLHTKASNTPLLRDAAEWLNILTHTCSYCRKERVFWGWWWMEREENECLCWDSVCVCVCVWIWFTPYSLVLTCLLVINIKSYYLVKMERNRISLSSLQEIYLHKVTKQTNKQTIVRIGFKGLTLSNSFCWILTQQWKVSPELCVCFTRFSATLQGFSFHLPKHSRYTSVL